jgi:hypothetical protein
VIRGQQNVRQSEVTMGNAMLVDPSQSLPDMPEDPETSNESIHIIGTNEARMLQAPVL